LVNPPIVDVCDLNFVETPLNTLPSTDVYDQTSAVELLDAIDREHCDRNGLPHGERIPIAQLLDLPREQKKAPCRGR
jgi:hypothetical protein